MLCEKCGKKEATFYYKENVNGVEKSYTLCSDCAAELQKNGTISGTTMSGDPFGQLHKLFSEDKLFGSLFNAGLKQPESRETPKCPLCGSTFAQLAKNGKVGCPGCYEAFEAELMPSIRRIHGRSTHTGKIPVRCREQNERKQKIAAMEKELKESVASENYERAAELRDQLRTLRENDAQ